MINAVVPVKALDASKSRLAAKGRRELVRGLSLAMMADVVEALRAVRSLGRVAVVTPDAEVARAAEAAGAEALLRDAPGLNPSIEQASAEVASEPGAGVLVVLGDVAALAAEDVERLLEAGAAGGVALAPSRDGGTSALLRVPRDAIPARFGEGSAKRHREEAQRRGVRYVELALPSLAIDVDVAEDAVEILRCGTLGRRTRAALAGFVAERA
ncbi:MAG TPA: 2-phospho-L-lactate guanylyltransferase [Myxococcota bacterium]|nr:2-phospho-L-lactate guanylyltransferase [Myxococcota bacterium]